MKIVNLFLEKRFLFTVVVPSFLWLLISVTYISVCMGWKNLIYFLPHEIIGIVLGVFTPIFLTVVLFAVFGLSSSDLLIADKLRRHGELIKDIPYVFNKITDEIRENRKLLIDDLEARDAISKETARAIEANNAGIEDIINRLGVIIRGDPEKAGSINRGDVNALAAVAQSVNAELADLSVSATQLLIHLMKAEKRDETETTDFIGGLVDAWSAGDRNVYFRVLHHQLANNPKRIKLLQSLSAESSKVSRNISKILRGMKGVSSLAERCDEDNIVRIVIEGSDLWALHDVLEPHFEKDGTAKA